MFGAFINIYLIIIREKIRAEIKTLNFVSAIQKKKKKTYLSQGLAQG